MALGVGSFGTPAHRVIRMQANPMDKCTIVSIYPKMIHEEKKTLFPGVFHIEAAVPPDFSILVVGPSSWFKEMEEGQPHLEIPNSSIQIAESIVKDYCNGLIGCDMGNCMPGLAYFPGQHNKEEIKTKFKPELAALQVKQDNYWRELVRIADIMWSRSNGNPLAINDDSRLAAKLLGQEKPWMQDFQSARLENCPACGQLVNMNFPVCQHCHTITNKEKYKALGLEQAKA